jgi:methyl-accepting chemotaxis protein
MKLGNVKIGQRLGAGFGLLILLMLATTGIGAFSLFQSTTGIDSIVGERYPQTILANLIKADALDAIGSIRDIQLDAGSIPVALPIIDQATEFGGKNIAQLRATMMTSKEGKELIGSVEEMRGLYLAVQQNFVDAVKKDDMERARNLFPEIKMSSENYLNTLDRLIQYQQDSVAEAGKQAVALSKKAFLVMLTLAVLACVLGGTIALTVARGITRPLNDAVAVAERVAQGDLMGDIAVRSHDETGKLMQSLKHMNGSLVHIVSEVRNSTDTIGAASSDIASGTLDLSRRTELQAASLEETAASMTELTATVTQNAANAEQADLLSTSAAQTAVVAGDILAQVINTMGEIKSSSGRIADIIDVIDSIAFQTNILALNAAVEAARAGSEGRGFAVVAAEVRSLAQRSALAAKEITALIRESVDQVNIGHGLADRAGSTMSDTLVAVQRVASIMGAIRAASQEQRAGIESVSGAITQMDQMTQQNAALVEQTSAASESLRMQARQLAAVVRFFTLCETDAGIGEAVADDALQPPAVPPPRLGHGG